MNVSIPSLRAFEALAETKNFTHAAEKCFMTQPAFSRLIASLEKEWGVTLINRTTRKVTLTTEGSLCLKHVKKILKEYALLTQEIKTATEQASVELRVGYNPVSGPPDFFVRALQKLKEDRPSFHISLIRSYSGELVRMLEEGTLDCALVSSSYIQQDSELSFKPLQPIYLNALIRRDNALAQKERLSLNDLSGMPIVFMKNTAPLTRKSIVQAFQSEGIPFTEDTDVVNLEDMILRVLIGSCVGISSFDDPNGQYPDVRVMRIAGFDAPRKQSSRGLAYRHDSVHPGIKLLTNILNEWAGKDAENGIFPFD